MVLNGYGKYLTEKETKIHKSYEAEHKNTNIPTFRESLNNNRLDLGSAPKKQGTERQTDFINVVAWRQTADFVAKYFNKGKMIIVEGSLRNNNYTDNNGTKHYGYDVYADNVTFGESKSASANAGGSYSAPVSNGGYNNSYSAPQQTAPQQNNAPVNNNMSVGDFGDFEEILGDGDVPF